VTVYDADEQDGYCFLVMELLTGGSVQDLLNSRRLTWGEATQIAADACRGLAAAHALGMIHRDIKPANIMRTTDGAVKLADFGLSKSVSHDSSSLTEQGSIMGTPHYMSPEQCRAETLDERSDLYSLGATYFALLTGRTPYTTDGTVQTMFAHCAQPVPDPRGFDPEIPAACAVVVQRAMAKNRSERFANAGQMLAALAAALQAEPPNARAPTIPPADPHLPFAAGVSTAPRSPALSLPPDRGDSRPGPGGSTTLGRGPAGRGPVSSAAAVLAPVTPPPLANEASSGGDSAVLGTVTVEAPALPRGTRNSRRSASKSRRRRLLVGIVAAVVLLSVVVLSIVKDRPQPGGTPATPAPQLTPASISGPVTLVAEFDLPVAQGEVRGLAFSPDDAFVYVAGNRGSVKKWNLDSRAATQEYRGQQGQVKALALSASGRVLAAGGVDQTLDVWVTDNGQNVHHETLGGGDLIALAFSPDDRWLAIGTHAVLRLYRVTDGKIELQQELANSMTRPVNGYIVSGVAFSPDGTRLAAVTWGEISVAVWEVSAQPLLDVLPRREHEPTAAIFVDSGQRLVLGYRTGEVKRWQPQTKLPAEDLQTVPPDIRTLALAPDQRTLVVAGQWGGPLRLCDLRATGSVRVIPDNSNAASYCLAFSHDARRMASGGGSETTSFVKLWRVVPVSAGR
jgi:WD40 repeat protein